MSKYDYGLFGMKNNEMSIGIDIKESSSYSIQKTLELQDDYNKTFFHLFEKEENSNASITKYIGQLFVCKKELVFKIRILDVWNNQHYQSALHYSHHFALTKKLVEYRKENHNDIEYIKEKITKKYYALEYLINTGITTNSLDAFNYGIAIDDWIHEHTSKIHNDVGKIYINTLANFDSLNLKQIPELINSIESETNSNKKGRFLEILMHKLFDKIKGFQIQDRIVTKTEEIDLVIFNNANDSVWAKESPLLMVECKNWSAKCGKNELVIFKEKLENRFGRVKLGFLVSWNGFSEKLTLETLRSSKKDILIIPLTGNDIKNAIKENKFESFLEEKWFESIKK